MKTTEITVRRKESRAFPVALDVCGGRTTVMTRKQAEDLSEQLIEILDGIPYSDPLVDLKQAIEGAHETLREIREIVEGGAV